MRIGEAKFWCRLWKKTASNGNEFISLQLQSWEESGW
jgi:hypothetical protein